MSIAFKWSAAFLIFHGLAFGQDGSPPRFEVASVKLNQPAGGRAELHFTPDGVTIRNYRLMFLIPYAFNIAVYQVSGAPAWVDTNTYDITARAPVGTSGDQFLRMLQELLVERFALKFHRERKEVSGYAVILTKDGPKFTVEKKPSEPGKDDGRVGAGPGRMSGHMVSSGVFAESISLYLRRPVIDRTGIDGLFNFALHWTPDGTEAQPLGAPNAAPVTHDPDAPSLFEALQEQLGLKLVSERSEIEMLVIDHIQATPTAN